MLTLTAQAASRMATLLAAVAAATALAAINPSPALADGATGGTVCTDPSDPQCDVYAGTPRKPGSGNRGNGTQSTGSSGGSSDTQCTFTPADISAEDIAALGSQPAGEGGWYFKTCVLDDGTAVAYPGPVWIAGSPPTVSPEVLARMARARLRLPAAVIRLNPAGDQLVNLPTWLTLNAASWQSQSATASVPGVSVTATARPVKAMWSLGEGGSVTCAGPGTAWTVGTDPLAASPDCGYTYRCSS
ncbi:MAG: hypothetical protein JXA67_03560, partial [Micromonosporaceae bacterium]|nr:hypothetical protein [Micromonosporaceae bacterium]